MPGNKAVFTEAVKKGHNAAWDGDWNKAISDYRRALVEMPADFSVHLSLSHALEEVGLLEDALEECRIALQFQPQDAESLVRAANLQEKLGRTSEAAGTYVATADLWVKQKAIGKAVEMWQRAAALEPERADIHLHLADVFEKGSRRSLAAKEYVALARIYQKRGDQSKTQQMAEKALALDPRNSSARSLAEQPASKMHATPENSAGPIDQAEKAALSRLAETLLEERQLKFTLPSEAEKGPRSKRLRSAEIDALIARAVDASSRNETADAIDCYRRLMEGGVSRPEVKFSLGLLYSETGHHAQAIELLDDMVSVPTYALASHIALGKSYRALGKVDAALEHFMHAAKIVDVANVGRDKADELISLYEGLAESYVAKGDRTKAESLSQALEDLLMSKGWEDKTRQVRERLDSMWQEGAQVTLAEVIEVPESTRVLEALSLSQEYERRGKLQAAEEECLRAIELAPLYIPAHVRLAEILTMTGHLEEASNKYKTLASLSLARGEKARAAGFERLVAKLTAKSNGESEPADPIAG